MTTGTDITQPEPPTDPEAVMDTEHQNEKVPDEVSVTNSPPVERARPPTVLVRLAVNASQELFHAPSSDEAFVCVQVDDHEETYPLSGRAARLWLTQLYYQATEKAPSNETINVAVNTLSARAFFNGPERNVWLRVGERDGSIYLDLADPSWRVGEISAEGWHIREDSDIRFRRPNYMRPLPVPQHGGSLEELRDFVNVDNDGDFILIVSWVIASLRPTGPFPVLAFLGEQGSAKSTTARVVRGLVDPNGAPLRSEPRETRDLMVAAKHNWVASFDNLSRLTGGLSDDLCRLATGGGFSARTLYTDSDETVFDAQRPVITTSITDVIRRGDLLDRALVVNLPSIPEHRRRPERDFWRAFSERCWTGWSRGCETRTAFNLIVIRAWRTSPAGW